MMQAFRKRQQGAPVQMLAILLCLVLAVLMILNVQMGGEAMWFWYAYAFRHGAKLYSQLHFALQPLFVLETALWTRLFGIKLIPYEVPSLLHALFMAVGIYLVLRESDWPDWQKGILLFATFVFTVAGHSYRFDDYHVITESLVLYAIVLLLRIAKLSSEADARRQAILVAILGVVCGLNIVNRVTDGTALAFASGLALLVLARRRKVTSVFLLVCVIVVTIALVVKLTGDTFSAYLSSSIFRAAASKGGTGSIASAPFKMEWNSLGYLRGQKKPLTALVLMAAAGWYLARRRPGASKWIVPAQLGIAALAIGLFVWHWKFEPEQGAIFEFMAVALTLGVYLIVVASLVDLIRSRRKGAGQEWQPLSVLFLIPICQWASYSAASSADPILNYYAPAAVVALLIPVVQPFRKQAAWANPLLVSVMVVLTLNGVISKVVMPYSWQNYRFPPMFTDRVWIQHPVYGPMYMDRENLQFSSMVCNAIDASPGRNQPALLSLPYPFPNYFCATPPWRDYVQTFFDTATRATVEHLVDQLRTSPPEWIVYQRQINIMVGAERLYNHGQPLAQRDLDALIMGSIASGRWTLVGESDYLHPGYWPNRKETDWYIVHTRPASGAVPFTNQADMRLHATMRP